MTKPFPNALMTTAAALIAMQTVPAAGGQPPAAPSPPNIVILVADDLGRRDVGFNGGDLATPNIDRLAHEGVSLGRFYAAPVCSPTRAGLMTGRYPIRFGLMRAVIPPWRDFGMDPAETTLPELLAEAGYRHRAIFGKWHLGHTSVRYHPLRRGFTRFAGHYNGAIDYFTHEREGERDWQHGYESVDEPGYATDLIAGHAVRFIDDHAADAEPFLLYVPFGAVHSPFQAKEPDLALFGDLPGIDLPRDWRVATAAAREPPADRRTRNRRVTAAMNRALDAGIGRILDRLDHHGVADDTFVLFFSDNGGVVGVGDNRPFRGSKGTVFEGGTRVAAAARWPAGGIAGGREVNAPVAYIDVLPTVLAMAELDRPEERPLDGVDVGAVLRGEQPRLDRDLYSFIAQLDPAVEQVSVTEPGWKLVVIGPALTDPDAAARSRVELFDIVDDPHETANLAADHPEAVARLLDKARAFRALQPDIHVPPFPAGRQGFVAPPRWRPADLPAPADPR